MRGVINLFKLVPASVEFRQNNRSTLKYHPYETGVDHRSAPERHVEGHRVDLSMPSRVAAPMVGVRAG